MKNTLTIDTNNSCNCDCLDYVNDGTNSIYLIVIVGDVESPKLTINGTTTTLKANDNNVIILNSTLFKPNVKITFNYSDEEHAGNTFTITFPNKLEGNLTIKHVDNFNYNAKYTKAGGGGGGEPYILPIASDTVLGGVKVGKNLTIESDGTLNAESGQQITIDNQLSETSENPVQNKVIAARLNEVFQSVSNGKVLVASAITDKGVATASDATFQTMAENVVKILTGVSYSGLYSQNCLKKYTKLSREV